MQSATSQGSNLIADVRVEREGDVTWVTLLGVDNPVFTAYQQSNPERVIVELSSVAPGRIAAPISVHDGLVERVSLLPFDSGSGDSMTRVEVSLTMPAKYDVMPGDEGLVIRVEALSGLTSSEPLEQEWLEAQGEADPWALDSEASLAEAETGWDAPAASRLTSIEALELDDGSLIRLRADGTVQSSVSFTLEDPDRLVIDLPDLESELVESNIELNAAHAARIRIGQHTEMVRVVIDAGDASDAFQGRRIVPAPDGLLIALGSGDELEEAVTAALAGAPAPVWEEPEALSDEWQAEEEVADLEAEADSFELLPAPEAEAAEAPLEAAEVADEDAGALPGGRATVYGVEHAVTGDVDRIVVLADRPVDYLVYEPDPETVILSLGGVSLAADAAVRINPEPGGPVSLVTAFEQPDVENGETRVVVKRAAGLKPQVSRRGPMLIMEFARGDVAALPPVLKMPATEIGTRDPYNPGAATAADLTPVPAMLAPAPSALAGPVTSVQAVPASLEPPASIDILREGGLMDGKEYTGRRISLDFKNVEVADVLRLIAEVSDLNVIAGDEVQGRVTIRLVDVPWDQALDVILLTKGLAFMRVGNVLRIAP
ncbi:MAG: AMIN domain-containing protein, partial [Myxococcota bacterium]